MLLCFSASHRTASFDQLEQLERRAADVTAALRAASSGSVVLATCNRFEAYLELPDAAATTPDDLVGLAAEAAGLDLDELRAASTLLAEDDIARHLFAVASGLESVVVGEGEIAGQVRRALERSRSDGTVTRDLERLFQEASRASRGVKNRTALGGAGRSIVRLALELASSRVTDWSEARVLMLGTGAYAGASLAALRDRGARDIRVFSRTGRAAAFAASHGIRAVESDGIAEAIAAADVIVACSVSPTVILDQELVERVIARPDAAPRRLIVDLGLPRNVDPSVAELDGVELLDLETISLHASLDDLQAADDARAVVGDAVAEYDAREAERAVEPTLVALRGHVFDLLDAEIARARERGDSSERTEQALRHLAGVLLHGPSVRARELARDGRGDEFAAGVDAVFGVADAEPAADHRGRDDVEGGSAGVAS